MLRQKAIFFHIKKTAFKIMDTKINHEKLNIMTDNEDVEICDDDADVSSSSEEHCKEAYDTCFDLHGPKYRKTHANCINDKVDIVGAVHIFDEKKNDASLNHIYKEECSVKECKKDSKEQRAKINLRERKRMHDLNKAMESLREVMPCANGPTMRKISKIATLSLARNYIQMLTRSIEELKMMLDDAYRTQSVGPAIARRRHAVAVHPYRHYAGIRNVDISGGIMNTADGCFTTGFQRCINIYGHPNRNFGSCAGLGCCTGTDVMQRELQNNICTVWNTGT